MGPACSLLDLSLLASQYDQNSLLVNYGQQVSFLDAFEVHTCPTGVWLRPRGIWLKLKALHLALIRVTMSSQGYGVHFFKVILESTLRKGQLKVPSSFTRRHWQGISNPVILSLPNGTKRKVYWLKDGCDVWFSNGWREFAKKLRLDVSHFVVFRYEGNSCFNVIIFGKSALEVEYPSSHDSNVEVEEINDTDFSAKFGEDHTSKSSKKRKIIPKEEDDDDDEPKHCKKDSGFDYSKQKNGGSSQGDFKRRIKMFHEKVKEMFYAENEHFTCLIQKTYTERDLLILPMEFSKPYLHKEGNATLFVDDGRSWDVGLRVNHYGQLTFSRGWRKFSLENKLKVGDVCGFELHNSEKFSFEVSIYRLEENSSTPIFKGHEQRLSNMPSSSFRTPVTPNASTSKSKDDLCIFIKSSNLPCQTISFKYIRSYVNESCSEIHGRLVTLRVGCRAWQVKLLCYNANSFARFSSGWPEFARECDLKPGDVCILKMIDVKKLVFEVSCLKGKISREENEVYK
ncbi:B3 domain-containing transcription factor VRN1 [Glycine soja]